MFTVFVIVMQPSDLCGRTLKPLPGLHGGHCAVRSYVTRCLPDVVSVDYGPKAKLIN